MRVIFPFVVRKATAHVDKKALNMRHQAQKGFHGIFVVIPQHQKVYLMYVPSTMKIISSYNVVFDESFSSAFAYTPQPYSETIDMRLSVTYTPCDKSSREKTGNIITFAQFEEAGLLSETRDNAGNCDESNDGSIIPPLLSKEEMNVMDSGDESEDEPMYMDMLEDICDGSQSHPSLNRREARYNICDCIK